MDGTSSTADMFNKRMFELGPFSPSGEFFQYIEPQIRDEAIYRGFQNTLRRIEFNVGLAYGDISDPQTIEKTATEIRNSKQRKYVLIDSIQTALDIRLTVCSTRSIHTRRSTTLRLPGRTTPITVGAIPSLTTLRRRNKSGQTTGLTSLMEF